MLANVLPLFKREDRQLKTNYRLVSLLPRLSKSCEKVFSFFVLLISLTRLVSFIGFKVVSVQGIPLLGNSFILLMTFMRLLRRTLR